MECISENVYSSSPVGHLVLIENKLNIQLSRIYLEREDLLMGFALLASGRSD